MPLKHIVADLNSERHIPSQNKAHLSTYIEANYLYTVVACHH